MEHLNTVIKIMMLAVTIYYTGFILYQYIRIKYFKK